MKKAPRGRFIALCHSRWAVPVLAELSRDKGCKFVTLANRLGISRDSLTRTLGRLVEEGWVIRNPGYGHPMRPEYILTPEGRPLGAWCLRAVEIIRKLKTEKTIFRKWSLGVALALGEGHGRFSQLMEYLPGVTARALAMTLKNLEAEGLVERVVLDAYPPVARYRLTRRGKKLAPLFVRVPV